MPPDFSRAATTDAADLVGLLVHYTARVRALSAKLPPDVAALLAFAETAIKTNINFARSPTPQRRKFLWFRYNVVERCPDCGAELASKPFGNSAHPDCADRHIDAWLDHAVSVLDQAGIPSADKDEAGVLIKKLLNGHSIPEALRGLQSKAGGKR
jgi:hypothetical protein